MSTFGMGIAAGVAQGSVQAAQVNRAQHRQQTDGPADAKRLREKVNAHLNALDEGDEANLISKVRVDDQMPQGRHGDDDDAEGDHAKRLASDEDGAKEDVTSEVTGEENADDKKERLYRHLDVTC